jgi:PIN domain nuclease of toxin-antitoxin system
VTAGLLLDTHAAIWWRSRSLLSVVAIDRIGEAAASRSLYLSPISAWELVFALQKEKLERRPDLGGLKPRAWFDATLHETGALTTEFTAEVATEAASLVAPYGSGDLGDCFLIATAHVFQLTLVTRDRRILRFAQDNPAYLSVLRC